MQKDNPKKIINTLCFMFSLFFFSFILSSCKNHIHEWEKHVVTQETCTTNGEILHQCISCGESYNEIIYATGHVETTLPSKEPTCTDNGLTEGTYCSKCNKTLTQQTIIPANGHDYQLSEKKEPTCIENGYSIYVCTKDSSHTYTETIEKIDHSYLDYKCINCGYAYYTEGITFKFYSTTTEHYSVEKCPNNIKDIILPNLYNNKPVNGIESSVFYNNNTLENITIPNSIKSIGRQAFYNCTNLKNVYFYGTIEDWLEITFDNEYSNPMFYAEKIYMLDENNQLSIVNDIIINEGTNINNYQFYGFSDISTIQINSSLTHIGNNAFGNCYNLKNINIPNTVNLIGSSAFENCTSLESLVLPSTLEKMGERMLLGCNNIVSLTLPYCPNKIVDLFSSDSSSNEELPISLKNVTILNGTEIINGYSFNNCQHIETIIIKDGITSIGDQAFTNCTSLNNVILPNSLVSIGSRAFYNCTSLNNVILPNSLVSIGSYAFYKCTSLNSIVLPKSVKKLGENTFYYCENLKNVIYNGNIEDWMKVELTSDFSSPMCYADKIYMIDQTNSYYEVVDVKIPDTIEIVNRYQFARFNTIKTVIVPSKVKTIDVFAFKYCKNLETITIDKGVEKIKKNAFYCCESLNSIILPNTLFEIEDSAFNSCNNLTDVYFNGNINDWIKITFKDTYSTPMSYAKNLYVLDENNDCYELIQEVVLEGVTSISDYAFLGCDTLTSIEIAEGVTNINKFAFKDCNSLTSITLPSTLKIIEDYAFSSCSNLENVEIPSSVDEIGNCIFSNCNNIKSLSLPLSSIGHLGKLFSDYNPIQNLPTSLKEVKILSNFSDYALDSCTYIENVVLGDNVTKINSSAFRFCESLKYIFIPNSVTSIEDNAFYRCKSLTSIEIPESVTRIGDYAFYNCASLERLSIPDSVETIGKNIIDHCTSLISLKVPFIGSNIDADEEEAVLSYFFGTGMRICDNKDLNDLYLTSKNTYTYTGFQQLRYNEITDSQMWYSVLSIIPDTLRDIEITRQTTIHRNTFYNCDLIENITLPGSIQNIEELAFGNCLNIKNIYFNSNIEDWLNIKFDKVYSNPNYYGKNFYVLDENNKYCLLSDIVISDSIKVINNFSLSFIESFESITIGNTLEKVEEFAFYDCNNLKNVYFNGSIEDWTKIYFEAESLLQTDETFANPMIYATNFYLLKNNQYTKLTELVIPNTVEIIGDAQFLGFDSITSLTIPNSVKSIGKYAFAFCSSLKSVSFEENCKTIRLEDGLFFSCSSLTNIKVPRGITEIGTCAFEYCTGLKSIYFPSSLKSIEYSAFFYCRNLAYVYYENDENNFEISIDNSKRLTSDAFGRNHNLTTAVWYYNTY